MKNCARYDRGEVQGEARITDEGYIRAHAVVTRTGVFNYQNADGTLRRELRHPDDVWDAESIASMEMIPVTNGHPHERLLTAENSKRLAIGYTGETVKKSGNLLMTKLVITDHEGVQAVKTHGRKELSLGYTVDVEPEEGVYNGERYDARQRNIRYNHLAIVDQARAGKEARIALDAQDAIEFFNEDKEMGKRKIKIDQDEYMVDETTADYIDRLENDLRNLRDEKRRVDDEIRMISDKLEKAEAERDSERERNRDMDREKREMKEMVSMDSAKFSQAVAERISLYECAKEHLDSQDLKNLDKMNNQQIMRAVISKARKSISLDGKSDTYIQAMYDTICDEKKEKVNLDGVKYMSRNDSSTPSDTENARTKMMSDQRTKSLGVK